MKNFKWLFLLSGLLLIAFFSVGMAYRYNTVLTNEDFIRFHVVANSNSEEDQAVKLQVRDRLVQYIDDALVREAVRKDEDTDGASLDIAESRAYITSHMDEIVAQAKQVLADEGFTYDVRAEFGPCWIPEKTYGQVTFPAGNYEALKIILGEGKGHNWWCVLYPPLCLIDSEVKNSPADSSADTGKTADSSTNSAIDMSVIDGKTADPQQLTMNDIILSDKYDDLLKAENPDAPATTLKLRFKTLELWKRFAN